MKFSRFTSHYSIFNQLALFSERMFLNISSISILSNRFLKILSKIFSQLRASELNFVEPQIGAFYNIEPIYPSFKLISKLFSKFFNQLFNQLFAAPSFTRRRKTRYNISPHFALSSRILFFIRFLFSPTHPLTFRGRRTGT